MECCRTMESCCGPEAKKILKQKVPTYASFFWSNTVQQVQRLFFLSPCWLFVLIESEQRPNWCALEKLGCELGSVWNQKVADRLHIFLEGRNLCFGLAQVDFVFIFFVCLVFFGCPLQCLQSFLLVNLNSEQRLPQCLFCIWAMNQSDRRFFVLVWVCSYLE